MKINCFALNACIGWELGKDFDLHIMLVIAGEQTHNSFLFLVVIWVFKERKILTVMSKH